MNYFLHLFFSRTLVLTGILVTVFVLCSCGQISEIPSAIGSSTGSSGSSGSAGSTGSSGSSGSTGSFTPTVSSAIPLAVTVHTQWETQPTIAASDFSQTCKVLSSSVGSTTNCSVAIPESQLYHSSLLMDVAVAEGSCDLLNYFPYHYQASALADFTPLWAPDATTKFNCSANPLTEPACFNGPAKELLATDFPKFGAISYPIVSLYFSHAYKFSSPFKLYGGPSASINSGGNTNRYFANNIASKTVAIAAGALDHGTIGSTGTAGDGYVANSMYGWEVICRDKYHEMLYDLKINISDSNSITNDIGGWP